MAEDIPDRMPEDIPGRMPERMSGNIFFGTSEDMSDTISNRLSVDMAK